jgi:hypothetical protein
MVYLYQAIVIKPDPGFIEGPKSEGTGSPGVLSAFHPERPTLGPECWRPSPPLKGYSIPRTCRFQVESSFHKSIVSFNRDHN